MTTGQTRDRLLESAAQEFAEHGFARATVRDICRRAGANIASVSYHFGDKRQLYSATFKHWAGLALQQFPPLMGVAEGSPAEQRLHGFVRGLLYRMLSTGAPAWHGQLMAREMSEPTVVIDELIADTVRPITDLIESLIRELLGPSASDCLVRTCAMSVIGQCCFYRHAHALVSRLFDRPTYADADIDTLADHVTRFSLHALSCYRSDLAAGESQPSCNAPDVADPSVG